MKRIEGLVPLSHDHHHALVVALRLKKGGPASWRDNWPEDPSAQKEALAEFAERELMPHFILEEELLFPVCSSSAGELKDAAVDLRNDHNTMRSLLADIASAETAKLPGLLVSLGTLLEAHIRKEERSFFPLLEGAISNGSVVVDLDLLASKYALYHTPPAC